MFLFRQNLNYLHLLIINPYQFFKSCCHISSFHILNLNCLSPSNMKKYHSPPPLSPITPPPFQQDIPYDPDLICFEKAYQNFMSRIASSSPKIRDFSDKPIPEENKVSLNDSIKFSVEKILEQFGK